MRNPDIHPTDYAEFDLMTSEANAPTDDALRILVIDDDPITLDILGALLSEAGFLVGLHNTPFGSAQIMRRDKPDLVLVDVEMPALKGDTIISNLRRNLLPGDAGGDAEYVLYSGTRATELDALTKKTGALGSIEKSSDFDAFLAKLTQLMHRSPRLSKKLQRLQ